MICHPRRNIWPAPTFDCGTNWAARPARRRGTRQSWAGSWPPSASCARSGLLCRGSLNRASLQITAAMHRLMSRAPSRLCARRLGRGGELVHAEPTGHRHRVPELVPLTDAEGQPVLIEDCRSRESPARWFVPESLRFASARGLPSRERLSSSAGGGRCRNLPSVR